ncbi:unnamed protein product [Knipowitschia caucasica]|uniref:Uncharacterized protein n=1 Tax=Knipowitschia caucasica TaxID=637954 RepID=A0AAV2LIX8_KNICA
MAPTDSGHKTQDRTTSQDQTRTNPLLIYNNADHLNNALGAIRVLGLEREDRDLQPHLTTVLKSIRDKKGGAPEQVVVSGILPVLALTLRNRGSQAVLATRLVSELADHSLVRKGFLDSGLVPALISVLTSPDQDLLIHSATALGRMCRESTQLQDQCVRCGAVPRLVSILLRASERPLLEEACLLALCNLSGRDLSDEGGVAWERGVSVHPGERCFTGSCPLRLWAGSWVTVVRVSQFAPGQVWQVSVNVEVMRRCTAGSWERLQGAPHSLFSVVRTGANVYKVLKNWTRTKTGTKRRPRNLRTRVFHTLL